MTDNSEFPRTTTPKAESGSGASPAPANQFIVGLVMIAALAAGSVAVGRWEAKAAAPAAPAAPAPAATEAAAPATPAPATETPAAPSPPTEALAAEVKEIKSQLEGLSAQIKGVQSKIEALPENSSVPDLKPIQSKVDGLVKSVAVLIPLTEKVGKIDDHVGSLGKQVEGLGAEVSALKRPPSTTPAAPVPTEEAPKVNQNADESAPAFQEAVDLFKKGKYKDALERFRKLTETDDKDARVWYYAALSSGLATANWTGGDALNFVKAGMEREKAGSPALDKIDATFHDLTAQTGKAWLSYYRKTAK